MSDSIKENNNNEIHNNIESIDKQNTTLDSDDESSVFIYNPDTENNTTNSPIFMKYIKELLQELYTFLLNISHKNEINYLYNRINNFLFEYDLDTKYVFKILTSNSQNIICYSSLIGFFYQYGIGCEVDEIKAFEIYSNTIKNDHKSILNQFSFYQKNETIIFYNDDIKKLNEIITQYFYSLFLYKDVIFYRVDTNYKLHIKNAEKGDNVSQHYIGNCYYYGINMRKNYNKAIEWYLKSSEGGNIKAMYMLACCYAHGSGVKKDEKKAFELYSKSAEGGYKHALIKVGNCYQYGNFTFEDQDKAYEFYLKAAEKNDSYSQYKLANYYNDGKHAPKNEEKGFYWIRKAAINGIIDAQFALAEYYLNNSINKNERKAFNWYLKLANDGVRKAMNLVANCYGDGIGTNKNLGEAIKWIEKYAKKSEFYDEDDNF
jgi:TPR repeat protein